MTLSEDLFANSSVQHVYNIHQRWVDIEARRRVLVAAFVLDIQCSVLFQCEPCFPLRSDSEPLDLPFPSSQELWDSIEMDTWQMLLTNWYPPSLRFLAHPLPPLDILQSSLLACHQLHRQSFKPPPLHPPKSLQLPAQISHEALSLSSLTPRHALIITASESWLFGTKIAEQSVWQDAKTTLRKWAESESAARAVWHAVRLLRMAFGAAEEQRLGQMHELWCLYLAGLVCWAFGYDRPFSAGFAKGEEKKTKKRGAAADTKGKSVAMPEELSAEDAESSAMEYLDNMNLLDWREMRKIGSEEKGNTRGLLECVRLRVADVSLGGLLNGAEDVLFRLVEGRSELVGF